MVKLSNSAAAASSAVLRVASYVFLRWIPGHHFVPLIISGLAVYVPSTYVILNCQDSDVARTDDRGGAKSHQRDGKTRGMSRKDSTEARQGGSFLRTICTGVPSRRSRIGTWVTIGINISVTLFALDFLLRGQLLYSTDDLAFSRVGYVSTDSAKLLVREPDSTKLPIHVSYREVQDQGEADPLEAGIIYKLDESTDYTASITLSGLQPSTNYRYHLSNDQSGEFTTPPPPGTEDSASLSSVTSSCIKPNFPYSPFSHPFRINGIELLTQAISKLPPFSRPSFMLFLGDFIYIDVPFRFGASVSTYRNEYRKVYSSPSWKVGQDPAINLPWIHTFDDHEIANDWAGGNATAPYPAAAEPYLHYHVSVNPPIPEKSFASPANTTYFSFTQGPASFFILDSRTYRSTPSLPNSTMLGSAQFQSLLAYIERPEPNGVKWKIISSSVPFTKNWQIGTHDTWGGFLDERRTVFEAIWRVEREQGVRIVLLSGDRHEFGATRFPDPILYSSSTGLSVSEPGAGRGIHEFSVGPLNMFYLPIRTYKYTDEQDVPIKYAPDGNSKFGSIHIENDEMAGSSVLTYSLYVDGRVVWEYALSVPLVAEKGRTLPAGEILLDETGVGGNGEWLRPRWEKAANRVNGILDGLLRRERVDY